MRAKEYIHLHQQDFKHIEIVSQIVNDLLPLRKDRVATGEYLNNRLSADIRYQHYTLQKKLFNRGNAMQLEEPSYEKIDGEISMDIALAVREELFLAVREDESFGYLFYYLGTEQNSRHNSTPIDCIPNDERIVQCISEHRDDYPKENLDDFINDDLNYQQYNILMDGQYWADDDALYLAFFNRVYTIYDELRLRKQSVLGVRSFLREQVFDTEAQKYWTYAYIITLIDKYGKDENSLFKCKQELMRMIEPIKNEFIPNSSIEQQSVVYLTERKGSKIDIIRILNVLYELGAFTGKNGKPISKKEYMTAMGKAINIDLSNYDKDLSRALSDSTTLDKHLKVFKEMTQKMTDIFNLH